MPEKKLKYEKYYTLDEKDVSWLPLCRDVRKALSKQGPVGATPVLTSNTGYVPRSFVEYSRAGGAVVGPYPLAPNCLPSSNIMNPNNLKENNHSPRQAKSPQMQPSSPCASIHNSHAHGNGNGNSRCYVAVDLGARRSYCHNAASSAYLNWDGNYLEAGVVGKTVDGVQHGRGSPPCSPPVSRYQPPSPIALRSTGSPTPPDQRVTRRLGVVDEEEDEDEFTAA
ncbi:hypothetical protein DFH09DRAFT_1076675 [Mycena vulgaris]|nr:hypothetical protein DFH09DRAFT_1076675 [Mycena vulgaris]